MDCLKAMLEQRKEPFRSGLASASEKTRPHLVMLMSDPRDISRIPSHMMHNIRRYIYDHEPVGDFLTAIITNNLKEACARADLENLQIIPAYVNYFYNYAPMTCWGNPEKMRAWLDGSWKSS